MGAGAVTFSPETVASLKVALALAGAILVAWPPGRGPETPARGRRVRDALLAGVAGLAALGFFDFAPARFVGALHGWEFYHHYVGARYFRELGYTRLYHCTVVADYEDGFPIPPAGRPVRRLDTNEMTTADVLLADADACRSRFTPERWNAFRSDVGWFRAQAPPRIWARALTDHGMNATPAWLVLATPLAGGGPLRPERLQWLALADPLLLAAMWAALFHAFGWRVAAAALIFWGTNHPAAPGWTWGAYLRQDWLAATGIGIALLRAGHPASAGAALAVGTLLRVLPGFLVAALALRAAIGCARRRSLRLPAFERRFAAGSVAALAVGIGLSAVVAGGPGAWAEFASNSRKHFRTPLTNFMGLPAALAFDPAQRVRTLRDRDLPDPFARWHAAVHERLERRAALRWGAAAAFAVLLGFAVARSAPWSAAVLGTGFVVVSLLAASYYYALLLVYGLLAARSPPLASALLVLSAATWGVASLPLADEEPYVASSVLCVAYVVLATLAIATRVPAEAEAPAAGT